MDGRRVVGEFASSQYALDTTVGTTAEVDMLGVKSGSIYIPTGSPITTLTFHAAPKAGGVYIPLYNGATAVTLTVQGGRAYALPADALAAGAMKIVVNAAGNVNVTLKGM